MPLQDFANDCEFLRDMPKGLIKRVDRLAHPRAFAAGTVLFIEGLTHPDFHLIIEGHVRLEMQVPQRGRVPILSVGPGEILAWSALVGNSVMTANAVALEKVRTLAFRADELRRLCESDHEVGFYFMRQLACALSRRLLATRLQLLDLFLEHVPTDRPTPDCGRLVDPEC